MRAYRGLRWSKVAFACVLASALSAEARDRLPVVFAHGLGVPTWPYETVIPLKRVFAEAGYEVHIARTPVAGAVAERARLLHEEIKRLAPLGKFHLVAHSMGGLDARLAIHRYGLAERCVSLTTLATPHRGSPLADFAMQSENRAGTGVFDVLKLLGADIEAVRDLTTGRMATFNTVVTDDPRVRYFSMGFFIPAPVEASSIIPWLWTAHGIVARAGFPNNDGEVSIESARWGEDLGSLPGDHYAETAPVPFAGRVIYRDVFRKVLRNLDQRF